MLANLMWARRIAENVARRLPTWFRAEDLIGPAEIGLIEAAERYDPASGVPFRAYAHARVFGSCISSIRRLEYVERAHLSLEARILDDGETLGDSIPDPGPGPHQALQAEQMRQVWCHVWQLPERHGRVVRLVYAEGLTLAQVARLESVGEPRMSAIHREALEMLRAVVSRNLLENCDLR